MDFGTPRPSPHLTNDDVYAIAKARGYVEHFEGGATSWCLDGVAVSPAYAQDEGLVNWMRRHLEEETE